jgi:hypothetical protein
MKIQKILRKIRQLVFQNAPDGLMSISYLFARPNSRAAQHRALWWYGKHPVMPRLIWIILQAWYWMRWMLFDAWLNIYRNLKYFGPRLHETSGISLRVQFLYLLRTTFWWAMPAHELYEYGLVGTNRSALDYVFVTECTGLHWFMNRNHTQSDALILADKLGTQNRLQALDVPVPMTDILRMGEPTVPITAILETRWNSIFCKQNSSNQGIGAFEAHFLDGNIHGRLYNGTLLDGPGVEAAWAKLRSMGDVLIQPMMQSDPDIKTNRATGALVTLRVVTRRVDDGIDVMAARLEIPVWNDKNQRRISYILAPINVATGQIEMAKNLGCNGTEMQGWIEAQIKSLPTSVLHWDQIVNHSQKAHQNIDLWAIAWDWAVTRDGPVMLEGNSGWGLETVQMANVGILPQLD